MTVAEIQNYIDDLLYKNNQIPTEETNWQGFYYRHKIIEIRDMLDELKPKAKWTNNMNGTFTCSRCGAKRPNDNYCGNCGARMELKENNK